MPLTSKNGSNRFDHERAPVNSVTALVSVVIPVDSSRCAAPALERCLEAARRQSHSKSELIVVLSEAREDLLAIAHEHGAQTLVCPDGKSAARNAGWRAATGDYVLHIDVDMVLQPDCVQECLNAVGAFDAVVLHENIDRNSYYHRVRRLLHANADESVHSPRFMTKSALSVTGGFDSEVDPIDEGSLKERLTACGFAIGRAPRAIVWTVDTRTIVDQWRAKFRSGQKARLFNQKYCASKQLRPVTRARSFLSRARGMLSDPLAFCAAVALKAGDFAAVCLGIVFTPRSVRTRLADLRNQSVFAQEGGSYEFEFYGKTLGAQSVDREERSIVSELLPEPTESPRTVLDIGCGGGRWSDLLLNRFPNADVVAVDRARAMVDYVRNRFALERFKAVEGEFASLPFDDGSFDVVLTIRAIKYAVDTEIAIRECRRVLRGGGTLVVEFPCANVVARLLRYVPFGSVSEYLRRANLHADEKLRSMIEGADFEIVQWRRAFCLPSTIYKSGLMNGRFVLGITKSIERMLPRSIFSRSIFVKAVARDRK